MLTVCTVWLQAANSVDGFYWWDTRRIGKWSIARYHAHCSPQCGFKLQIQWMVSADHAHYSSQCGFELQVQWMVSTGGILRELVSGP